MFIKGLLLGGRGSVWNRCVTCESNVCSEQTSENLVDKILDQLKKKKHDFWNLWMPWFSVLSFFNDFFFIKLSSFKTSFWQYYVIFLEWVDGSVACM